MITFDPRLWKRGGESERQRRIAVEVMQAALQAVDPYQAVRNHLRLDGERLLAGEQTYDLSRIDKVWIVGGGKAGAPMVRAVEDILGDRIAGGCVNVKYGHSQPTRIVRLHEAGHPVPDEAGVAGAQVIRALLERTGPADLVLCLISGGGSALMSLPAPGISLADMQTLTGALLRVGATINEINTIRKHLEQLKGGRLAQLAHPAPVLSLILSDVVGNPLDVIASGPTVPDTSSYADAWESVERYDLVPQLPPAILDALQKGRDGLRPETPKLGDSALDRVQNLIIASNTLAAASSEARAQELGLKALFLTSYLQGEAREVAQVLAAIAREMRASGRPIAPPACVILGGETTVTLRGAGKGGRNQEMALAAALALEGMTDCLIACLATDGTDGPTDASGAVADGTTVARGRALGLDAYAYLADNDAYPFMAALDDLLLTGPTHTNVNDLALVFCW